MEITVISPKREKKKIRACAYARVSTEAEEQENSLINQMEHYAEAIGSDPRYEFVGVYHDFGISGFKEKRPGFMKMMEDARAGKIDLIITKSISRMARNTKVMLDAVRELKAMGVGVYFELQDINTLTEEGELLLTVHSAFAQAESESASAVGKMAYQRRYEAGIPIQYLERSLGYAKDESGNFVPDPEEAAWVKTIYEMAADGHEPAEIARTLNDCGARTPKGCAFSCGAVIRIIENEIYKGDYIMHKHFVDERRRIVRNEGQADSWYVTDDHEAIVSRRLWQKAQDMLAKRREYLSAAGDGGDGEKYAGRLFCADCGHPLYRRTYSGGRRACWGCSGMRRFGKGFCQGINVPEPVIRGWGDFDGNIYIRKERDKKGTWRFRFVSEKFWKNSHRKKEHTGTAPALTEKNYPYYGHLFCANCGGRLVRQCQKGDVTWVCNTRKRKGKEACPGVRIKDDEVRGFGYKGGDIYISEEVGKDGKKRHGHSRRGENEKGQG